MNFNNINDCRKMLITTLVRKCKILYYNKRFYYQYVMSIYM